MSVRPALLSVVLAAAALPVLGTAATAQSVIVVDAHNGPGTDYTELPGAIHLAGPQDVVLVRPGNYFQLTLDGRGAQIVADDPQPGVEPDVHILRAQVWNVPADQAVLLRGIVFGDESNPLPALRIEDCAGAVLVQDSRTAGSAPSLHSSLLPSIVVQHSPRVTFTASVLHGRKVGVPQDSGVLSTEALVIEDSQVAIEGCEVVGADGQGGFQPGPSVYLAATPGVPAVRLQGGRLFVRGGQVRGGQGGYAILNGSGECLAGADGGVAIAASAGAEVLLRDAHLAGGAAGGPGPQPGSAACPTGSDAAPLELNGATAVVLEGGADLLACAPLAFEGHSLEVVVTGRPGDFAWLIVGLGQVQEWRPQSGGVVLPTSDALLPLGPLPPVGRLLVTGTVRLPMGFEGQVLVLQSVLVPPGAAPSLGGGRATLLLSASFD